jgi:hypothetical protein
MINHDKEQHSALVSLAGNGHLQHDNKKANLVDGMSHIGRMQAI